jgi:hypothetical protein
MMMVAALTGSLLWSAGCARQNQATKTMVIRSNVETTTRYGVRFETDQSGDVNLQCCVDGVPVDHLLLENGSAIPVELIVEQRDVPFSLLRGRAIEGELVVEPLSGRGPVLRLPVSVFFRSWLASNFWLFVVLASLITLAVLFNLAMLIFKAPVRGSVDILYPPYPGGTMPLYPSSRVFHHKRNMYSIGTGEKDGFHIDNDKLSLEDEPGPRILPSHLMLRFERKKGLGVQVSVKSRRECYYRTGPLKRVPDQTVRARPDLQPLVPDYRAANYSDNGRVREDEDYYMVLHQMGYSPASSFRLPLKEEALVVLDRNLVLKLCT